jgi:two-component system cell cycle response regulator
MNGKILIADDDRMFVELLWARLEADGFEVEVAYDSVQALNLAMRLRPAVILLDILMPGGSGLETLKRLKRSSLTHGIPVIVTSALKDPALAATVNALGAVDFLPKPVDYEHVRVCLNRYVQRAQPAA